MESCRSSNTAHVPAPELIGTVNGESEPPDDHHDQDACASTMCGWVESSCSGRTGRPHGAVSVLGLKPQSQLSTGCRSPADVPDEHPQTAITTRTQVPARCEAGQGAVAAEGRQTPRCSVSAGAQASISALDGMSLTADVADEHSR